MRFPQSRHKNKNKTRVYAKIGMCDNDDDKPRASRKKRIRRIVCSSLKGAKSPVCTRNNDDDDDGGLESKRKTGTRYRRSRSLPRSCFWGRASFIYVHTYAGREKGEKRNTREKRNVECLNIEVASAFAKKKKTKHTPPWNNSRDSGLKRTIACAFYIRACESVYSSAKRRFSSSSRAPRKNSPRRNPERVFRTRTRPLSRKRREKCRGLVARIPFCSKPRELRRRACKQTKNRRREKRSSLLSYLFAATMSFVR